MENVGPNMMETDNPKATKEDKSKSSEPETLLFSHANRKALRHFLPDPKTPGDELHVTLTYAQSLDGMIALDRGVRTYLSGPESKAMTHYLRSVHDAILIGVGTAETDNPSLNCRFGESLEAGPVGYELQPIPVILDPNHRWEPAQSKIIALAREKKGKPPLWLVTEDGRNHDDDDLEHEMAVASVGGSVIVIDDWEKGRPPKMSEKYTSRSVFMPWDKILQALQSKGINSVMVEGGARVINRLYEPGNRPYVSSVIITQTARYLGEGGVTVCPMRSKKDQRAVAFKCFKWIPLGLDMVLAAVMN